MIIHSWYRGWPPLPATTAWDYNLRWYLEDSSDPDWSLDPLTLEFVRDQHLRSPNGSAEDEYLTHLIRASYREAEHITQRTLIPQSRVLVADGFPSSGTFVLPRPPIISVTNIDWIDGDGADQALTGSPEQFFVEPATRRVTPLYLESWPTSRSFMGSVRITYVAGYEVNAAGKASIPEDITQGRIQLIGEWYKQRSESVHAFNQNPAILRARDRFKRYTVYGHQVRSDS